MTYRDDELARRDYARSRELYRIATEIEEASPHITRGEIVERIRERAKFWDDQAQRTVAPR